jgi:hypothetical protein
MPNDTILWWNSTLSTPTGHVTVADYKAWRAEGEGGKGKIAEFFRGRMWERYIGPVLALDADEKNGFSIMAVSCLLIETYETFRQGWPSSDNKSALAFCRFFDREDLFRDFSGHAQQFYKNVRCGILHQGETTSGWQITREHGEPLFDPSTHTVHATKFHTRLAKVIDQYRDDLNANSLASDIWKNFITKMNATIENCEV